MIKSLKKKYKWKLIFFLTTSWIFWVLLLCLLMVAMICSGVAYGQTLDDSSEQCSLNSKNATYPANVEALRPDVEDSMTKYNIPKKFENIVMGQLYQESGGIQSVLDTDPMQSSESKCGQIGCITDPKISIDQAMKVHRDHINEAKKLNMDIDKTNTQEAILQSYNFGGGYLNYLAGSPSTKDDDKKHTTKTAKEYSIDHTTQTTSCPFDTENKACYGDYMYVDHVLKKSKTSCGEGNGQINTLPIRKNSYSVSQKWGTINDLEPTGHTGIDLAAPEGTPIRAVGDGEVIFNGQDPAGANVIMIKHDTELYSVYAHLQKPAIPKQGDTVKAGETIGYVGSTGNSTGNHLHFEIRTDAKYGSMEGSKDPENYLPLYENATNKNDL